MVLTGVGVELKSPRINFFLQYLSANWLTTLLRESFVCQSSTVTQPHIPSYAASYDPIRVMAAPSSLFSTADWNCWPQHSTAEGSRSCRACSTPFGSLLFCSFSLWPHMTGGHKELKLLLSVWILLCWISTGLAWRHSKALPVTETQRGPYLNFGELSPILH